MDERELTWKRNAERGLELVRRLRGGTSTRVKVTH
jgi:hypothetical protein